MQMLTLRVGVRPDEDVASVWIAMDCRHNHRVSLVLLGKWHSVLALQQRGRTSIPDSCKNTCPESRTLLNLNKIGG